MYTTNYALKVSNTLKTQVLIHGNLSLIAYWYNIGFPSQNFGFKAGLGKYVFQKNIFS